MMKFSIAIVFVIIIAVIYVVLYEPLRADYKKTKSEEARMKKIISL